MKGILNNAKEKMCILKIDYTTRRGLNDMYL